MGIIVRQSLKNNIITAVGVFIGFLNILIIQPFVLSPNELGLIRLLFSISTLFASIFPLGLNVFTLKFFPYIKNSRNGHNGFLGFLLLSSSILFVLVSFFFYYYKSEFLLKYSNSALFINHFDYIFPLSYFLGVFSLLTSYSSSIFKSTFPSFLNEIILRIFIVISIGLYYIKLISFEVLINIYILSYLLIIILLINYFKKTDTINFKINWGIFKIIPIKEALKFTFIMSVTTLASISIKNIDSAFIGSYLGLAEVAVYTIAFTISSMIDVPGNALAKIIVPKISEAFKNNDMNFVKNVYYKSTRVSIIVGSLIFLLIFTNAHEILSILPQKYGEGQHVLKIIAVGSFINSISGLNFCVIQY
ncbi:MAG: lipopolysaccharide biosynthesis protein, partial [Bacteroidota bacterium]